MLKYMGWFQENWFRVGVLSSILLIGIFVVYYFLIFLPQQEREAYREELSRLQQQSQETIKRTQIEVEGLEKRIEHEIQNQELLKGEVGETEGSEEITSADVQPFLSGNVVLHCYNHVDGGEINEVSSASATLWATNKSKNNLKYFLLTNKHAVPSSVKRCEFCNSNGCHDVDLSISYSWNVHTDTSVYTILPYNRLALTTVFSCEECLNFDVLPAPLCPPQQPINSPVVVIGYPAFTRS